MGILYHMCQMEYLFNKNLFFSGIKLFLRGYISLPYYFFAENAFLTGRIIIKHVLGA